MTAPPPLLLDDYPDVALLSIAQAAQLWDCSPRTIRRLLASGALRWVPLFSDKRIPATGLKSYIDRHLAHPPLAARPRQLRRPRSV